MKHLFVFGTRPEAIKMAPLIKTFDHAGCDYKVCVTAQHREMLDQVMSFFEIHADYDLNIMSPNQTLHDITSKCLLGLKDVLNEYQPDNVFVQGDTTTAFVGALASFYQQVKVSHIEAGLRSGNKYSPYPEEINRILAGRLADYHFAPTQKAVENLKMEGITENVYLVGNSVIDALFLGLDIIKDSEENKMIDYFNYLDFSKRIVLVTGHRRESFGEPFLNICGAIKTLAHNYPDTQWVYPVHLNPNVQKPVNELLSGMANVHLVEPLKYPKLIWLMNQSYFVLTDSGGIQEEAPSLGKPVLVMREVTERTEGIEAGTAELVGSSKNKIIEKSSKLMNDFEYYSNMASAINPYGNGTTAEQILKILEKSEGK